MKDEELSDQNKKKVFSRLSKHISKTHESKMRSRPLVGLTGIIFIIFVMSINIFPVLADQLDEIPVVSDIIKIVKFDKGLQQLSQKDSGICEAVKNRYSQNANISVEDQDMIFTLETVLADSKRMLITYSLTPDRTRYNIMDSVWFNNLLITGNGETLAEVKNGMTMFNPEGIYIARNIVGPGEIDKLGIPVPDEMKDNGDKRYGWIEILKQDNNHPFPEAIKIEIDGFQDSVFDNAKRLPGNWTIEFNIPEEFRKVEPVKLKEQNITVSSGKYHLDLKIEDGKIYPTVTTLGVRVLNFYDSPQRLSLNMYLQDEKENIYNKTDGDFITQVGFTEPEFASSYFTNPKELYLVIESITDPATRAIQVINQRVKLKE